MGSRAAPRRIERATVRVTLPGGEPVELERVRDPRARRMRLSVDSRGARLTLPLRASDAAGARFVIEHAPWLLEQLARRDTDAAALQPHQTAQLPLRGEPVPLAWAEGRTMRVQLDDAGISIAAPATVTPAALQRGLRDFYEAQARADIGRWLPGYLAGLPRAPSRVRFRIMSSLWGSLTRDAAMTLDLALVLARPQAFEYVLVHELCHLIHMDHSDAFWHEVERRCPEWRAHRAYFRSEGRQLKATLQVLCAGG